VLKVALLLVALLLSALPLAATTLLNDSPDDDCPLFAEYPAFLAPHTQVTSRLPSVLVAALTCPTQGAHLLISTPRPHWGAKPARVDLCCRRNCWIPRSHRV